MRRRTPEMKKKIKEFCEQYYLKNGGRSPSAREIGAEFGVHYSTAARYLIEMEEEGMIELDRSAKTTDITEKMSHVVSGISVSGSIPCGPAEAVEEEITDYVSIPDLFLDDGRGDYFILVASHDSMIDAGIDDGDYVILRRTERAQDGQIVAALLNGHESTLKRYCVDRGTSFLWAENNRWEIPERYFPMDDCSIQGVMVSVVKIGRRKHLTDETLARIREYRGED